MRDYKKRAHKENKIFLLKERLFFNFWEEGKMDLVYETICQRVTLITSIVSKNRISLTLSL